MLETGGDYAESMNRTPAVPFRIHAANLPVAVEDTIAVEVNYEQVEPWTISAQREEEE